MTVNDNIGFSVNNGGVLNGCNMPIKPNISTINSKKSTESSPQSDDDLVKIYNNNNCKDDYNNYIPKNASVKSIKLTDKEQQKANYTLDMLDKYSNLHTTLANEVSNIKNNLTTDQIDGQKPEIASMLATLKTILVFLGEITNSKANLQKRLSDLSANLNTIMAQTQSFMIDAGIKATADAEATRIANNKHTGLLMLLISFAECVVGVILMALTSVLGPVTAIAGALMFADGVTRGVGSVQMMIDPESTVENTLISGGFMGMVLGEGEFAKVMGHIISGIMVVASLGTAGLAVAAAKVAESVVTATFLAIIQMLSALSSTAGYVMSFFNDDKIKELSGQFSNGIAGAIAALALVDTTDETTRKTVQCAMLAVNALSTGITGYYASQTLKPGMFMKAMGAFGTGVAGYGFQGGVDGLSAGGYGIMQNDTKFKFSISDSNVDKLNNCRELIHSENQKLIQSQQDSRGDLVNLPEIMKILNNMVQIFDNMFSQLITPSRRGNVA